METPNPHWYIVKFCSCGRSIARVDRIQGCDIITCLRCGRNYDDRCEWIDKRKLKDNTNEELMKYVPDNKISLTKADGYALVL